MVAVGSYYNISEREIEAVTKEDSGDPQYPYRLKVQTKTGHNYIVNYQSKSDRDTAAMRIVHAVDVYHQNHDTAIDVIRWAIADEVNKLRPYLREIKKLLTDKGGD